ncbi:transcriptional regulator, TetR family [Georgenia satyanarayanai]|uniref:Transcriptional regulator, TetR family n=1 Tax=Georgenia satyanarayanai TaxID=860221 RepID=A0A2Y9ARN3_9MICO|nr:TetR/AcrR family transcriptional regulator [Georgenia satyanarayanai]PYF98272.1 TetR family transcriptional regulator [Georgenia satyanarayanai]SSA45157.1 transcriptional regulator, TetR family [Georgenia satyanarayanai]
MSAREKVLDAFEDLLVTEGARATTLDAVAARAEVSKGGLLYHFRSKDALVEGLLERLAALAAADTEAMAADPRGPSAYYVDTSVADGSPLDRAIVAAAGLAQEANARARGALHEIHRGWFRLILEEVGDRATARAIVLLGDGLYYNAVLAGAIASDDVAATGPQDRAELLEVVALLTERAAQG